MLIIIEAYKVNEEKTEQSEESKSLNVNSKLKREMLLNKRTYQLF